MQLVDQEKDLMIVPVAKLPVTENFLLRCTLMGFVNLREISEAGPDRLISLNGFSYGWLAELSALMSGLGLLHLLQPPMKNRSYRSV